MKKKNVHVSFHRIIVFITIQAIQSDRSGVFIRSVVILNRV